jgi:hypothetical protein
MNRLRIQAKLRELFHVLLNAENISLQNGQILSNLNAELESKNLKDYEFRIFSQWGEDGIIQKLVSSIPIPNRTFIEFGVETFLESNCRFLMMKDNWSGFIIDGSSKNVDKIKNSSFFWKYDLRAIEAFIDRDNINDLIAQSGFHEDLGLLSIDLDGVDYWILEVINTVKPRILVVEYNAAFGSKRAISVPYRADFSRTKAHPSNLFWGASLGAFVHYAKNNGYELVGTNSAGINAFFVRADLVAGSELTVMGIEDGFTDSRFRQSLDENGGLTYIRFDGLQEALARLTVVNVETMEFEEF